MRQRVVVLGRDALILSEQHGDLGIGRHAPDFGPAGTQKPDVIAYF
jgi:hypothetical protein